MRNLARLLLAIAAPAIACPNDSSHTGARGPDTHRAGDMRIRGDMRIAGAVLRDRAHATQDAPRTNPGGQSSEDTRVIGMGAKPDPRLTMTADDEITAAIAPTEAEDEAPEGFSKAELVGSAPAAAAEALRTHLKAHPDDFHAMPLLAVALLGSKHPQEAAAVIVNSYKSDPLLTKEPLVAKELGLDAAHLSSLAGAAATAAKQANTPQAWLLAAALYQGSAMPRRAQRLRSARKAGLDADLTSSFATELKKKADKPERVRTASK